MQSKELGGRYTSQLFRAASGRRGLLNKNSSATCGILLCEMLASKVLEVPKPGPCHSSWLLTKAKR